MAKITLGGREYTLSYTLNALDEMEKQFNGNVQMDDKGLTDIIENRRKFVGTFVILANEGEIEKGRPGDITYEEITHKVRPGKIVELQKAVMSAIIEGSRMEADEDGDGEEEVDVVLDELKKKETPGA